VRSLETRITTVLERFILNPVIGQGLFLLVSGQIMHIGLVRLFQDQMRIGLE
jgi:hypothetical protein